MAPSARSGYPLAPGKGTVRPVLGQLRRVLPLDGQPPRTARRLVFRWNARRGYVHTTAAKTQRTG